MPELILHGLAPSHPCMAAEAALKVKGLEYERVDFQPGTHIEEMPKIYGEGNYRVPGMTVDGDPVHGSRPILAKLEEIEPNPALFPSDEVREAERWGDEEFQEYGRQFSWGSLAFRPEAMGTFGGGEPLDGAGIDFAMKFLRQAWKYHNISAERLQNDLAALPAKADHIRGLIDDGVIGGEQPNAADLQIGSTVRVLLCVGDVEPHLQGAPADLALKLFPDYPGHVPAGAFPAGWI